MKQIALTLVFALWGCSSFQQSNVQADESAPLTQVAPMTATGPTKEVFVRLESIKDMAPGLIDAIVKTKTLRDAFRFRLNILVPPDDLDAAKAWLARSIDLHGLEVRWVSITGQQLLPGNTYVQDSFHFFWDETQNDIRLLTPNHPDFLDTYTDVSNLLGIPLVEMESFHSDKYKVSSAMSGYGAGGNWEFLPGGIVTSLAPSLYEKFIDQVPDQSGAEFDYFYDEEYQFVEGDNPGLDSEQLHQKTIELITHPNFTEVKRLGVSLYGEMGRVFTQQGYDVLEIDSYTPFQKRLTDVDHVDEHFAAFRTPRGGNCQVGLIVPNPLEALDILHQENKPRTEAEKTSCREISDKLYSHSGAMGSIVGDLERAKQIGCFPLNGITDDVFASLLADFRENSESESAQIKYTVDQVVSKLAEKGCHDPLIIEVPSFLGVNVANALVLTPYGDDATSVIVRPDSFYEPIERIIKERLAGAGVESFTANSLSLSIGNGNLHCATNTITDGYPIAE